MLLAVTMGRHQAAMATMIAGIDGMNFKHLPELDRELGNPLAMSAMIGLDALRYYGFRRIRWL